MKKFVALFTAVLSIILCGCAGGIQKTGKTDKFDDCEFYVSIELPKNRFSLSETPTATLTLVNNSGKDIDYELADYLCKYYIDEGVEPNENDALSLEIINDGETVAHESVKVEKRFNGTIKNGATLIKQVKVKFDSKGKKHLKCVVPLYLKNSSDGIFSVRRTIETEELTIVVS